MSVAGGVGPVERETTDMAWVVAVGDVGVSAMSAAKGNLVHWRAVETWYASESWTEPAQRMMLLSLMNLMRSG